MLGPVPAQDEPPDGEPLAELEALDELSLEELLEVEVTVVSREKARVGGVPAAVHVVTRQDIQRSGLLTLPEILRLVPGLTVARIDASRWSIGSRGFAGEFSNKMLVLIDGRQVYTPVFGGVHWDVQDVPVEDIERIEVIRGPGGARWGANAVNGVIHVVTRSSADTQGGMVRTTIGNANRVIGTLRYGGRLDEQTTFRVHGRYLERSPQFDADGRTADDGQDLGQFGFRVDGREDGRDLWTLSGGAYHGVSEVPGKLPLDRPPYVDDSRIRSGVAGGHLLGRYTPELLEGRKTTFELTLDADERDTPGLTEERRRSFAFDYSQDLLSDDRHRLTAGLGYRFYWVELESSPRLLQREDDRTADVVSAFVEDELGLSDSVTLHLGAKFEHNDFTGFEVQPDARLTWRAAETTTVWTAVSRAVHVPTFINQGDLAIAVGSVPGPGGVPNSLYMVGNDEFDAEELWSYEAGLRIRPHPTVFLDTALFYGDYDGLQWFRLGTSRFEPSVPRVFVPLVTHNDIAAESYGGEISLGLDLTEDWKLTASYSLARVETRALHPDTLAGTERFEGLSPRHQAQLHSHHDLGSNWSADANLYFYDRVPALDIASYVRVDTHVGWRPNQHTRLDVALTNLLDDQHRESRGEFFTRSTEVGRGISFTVTHDF